MLSRSRFVVLGLLLIALVMPAAAAERVKELPEIKPAMAARFDIALVLNDQPFIVGKGEIASATRAHFVLKALADPQATGFGAQEATLEVVVYDDKVYTREDDSTEWNVAEMSDLPVNAPVKASADVAEAPISEIGSTPIAGVPTTQYQVWIADEQQKDLDHMALDFFIGQEINYLYQQQTSIYASDKDLGAIKLETVIRLYDFDDPSIAVGPPTGTVQPAMSGTTFIAPLRNGGILRTLTAPLATPELHQLAVQRFGR